MVKSSQLKLQTEKWEEWRVCFEVSDFEMPAGEIYLGFSAATGDVSDAHEYVRDLNHAKRLRYSLTCPCSQYHFRLHKPDIHKQDVRRTATQRSTITQGAKLQGSLGVRVRILVPLLLESDWSGVLLCVCILGMGEWNDADPLYCHLISIARLFSEPITPKRTVNDFDI